MLITIDKEKMEDLIGDLNKLLISLELQQLSIDKVVTKNQRYEDNNKCKAE